MDQRGCRGGKQKHRCIVLLISNMLGAELPPQVFKIDQEDLRHENSFFFLIFVKLLPKFSSYTGLKSSSNVCHHRYISHF